MLAHSLFLRQFNLSLVGKAGVIISLSQVRAQPGGPSIFAYAAIVAIKHSENMHVFRLRKIEDATVNNLVSAERQKLATAGCLRVPRCVQKLTMGRLLYPLM